MSTNLSKAINLYNQKQLPKAAKLLNKDKSPCKDSLKLLMMVEFNLGNHSKAIVAAKKVLSKTAEPIYVRDACNIITICGKHLKDPRIEREYLEKSVRSDSTESNAKAIYHLLLLLFHEQNFVKVEKLAEILLAWKASRATVSFILIEVASKQGNKKLLIERLQKAPEFYDEFNLQQLGAISNFLISTSLFQLAEKTIDYIINKFKYDGKPLKLALLLAKKDTQGALQFFEQNKHLLPPHEGFYFKAKLALLQGEYNKEYSALIKAAEAQKKEFNKINANSDIALFNNTIPKLAKVLLSSKDSYGEKNTFIMGFPRSGTTLLDNILDTQKDMLVLSERSVFGHLIDKFKSFKNYPQDIYKLRKSEIHTLRQRYIEHISEQGCVLPQSGIIIEKEPHLTAALPFIKQIFPSAKIIVTLRHPLDVCMSCFQTRFASNILNNDLITMEDIVERYIEVFTLLERYQSKLAIQLQFIRYEDLVTDIKGEMTKIFDYMEVTPNNDYLSFHKHADNKYVTSASRGQTNQPLYKSSMYKWRNYDQYLTFYKEKLGYFIEKFGYDI